MFCEHRTFGFETDQLRFADRQTVMTVVVAGLLALAGLAAGCATNPATGSPATGRSLGLQTEAEHFSYNRQQTVAEVRYRDSAGRPAGNANVYQTKRVSGTVIHWRPTEGGTVIDDQDFFRIAGDEKAAADIADHRRQGVLLNRVGWVLMALGAGGIAATSTLMDEATTTGKTVGGVSVLSLIIGGLWVYAGHHRMKPESHLFEIDRAREAANRYNATLNTETGTPPP